MKAAFISNYGGPEVLKFGEIPSPAITAGMVIIQVKAVSVNPVDFKIRDGALRIFTGKKFPKVLGHDFSGIVDQVGEGVSEFKKGDQVYGYAAVLFGKTGAMSELAMVAPKQLRKLPEGMTFEEAASIPVAALTALNGFQKAGSLNGKKVLVNGATGGVGHFAVQIAKAKGAHVTATCSTKNIELAKKFGADEIIDYTKQDVAALTQKYDSILDAFGKMKYSTAIRLLTVKGVYASTLMMPTAFLSSFFYKMFYNKTLTPASMKGKPDDFREVEELFKTGKVKPLIESIFPLEKTTEAFKLLENGKPRGKVVITV
ncbi:MAG: NAD(P)-dependent alcohol dehydrogenase [Bacteroidales bacterium]|nr:NAD(P)-dependent alcohol dehydrogenase [Bacteroidales bacterium]